ncbi:MAG: WYL domain-containing protein [Peptostreptococcaceae bacterium]|nr:WYL domain-containing protein [Peptostreptococcaceae bacterium]
MDKTARMLLLYSLLADGAKVRKLNFCMETDSLPRSFDRDIEDMRLYLSEIYDDRELLYDRRENSYYLRGTFRSELEVMEYQFIERILLDTAGLRKDEMDTLLLHLASNAEKSAALTQKKNSLMEKYEEPLHRKSLLKMHGDLAQIICNQAVIRLRYTKAGGDRVEREVIPCALKYDLGYLYLIAYLVDREEEYPAYFRLDRIHSFDLIRSRTRGEDSLVSRYQDLYAKGITQMYGGDFIEIDLACRPDYHPYVRDKFRESKIIKRGEEEILLRLWAFDAGFVKWILSQPADKVWVVNPSSLKDKITEEARKIILKYGGANEWQERYDSRWRWKTESKSEIWMS